jgi:hypothetical protein
MLKSAGHDMQYRLNGEANRGAQCRSLAFLVFHEDLRTPIANLREGNNTNIFSSHPPLSEQKSILL